MRVVINGEAMEVAEGASVADVAATLEVDRRRRGVAIAVDGEVVPRSELERTTLTDGARVEVVEAMQGGSQ